MIPTLLLFIGPLSYLLSVQVVNLKEGMTTNMRLSTGSTSSKKRNNALGPLISPTNSSDNGDQSTWHNVTSMMSGRIRV